MEKCWVGKAALVYGRNGMRGKGGRKVGGRWRKGREGGKGRRGREGGRGNRGGKRETGKERDMEGKGRRGRKKRKK